MPAYIPLIKTTRWIDLSTIHKQLREELENDVNDACINKMQLQPIMLQGAFGIGKTNSLYYLFHYGWCKLKTPTFYISLDILTQPIKEFALKHPSGKIQNSELGSCISTILHKQIDRLKNDDWDSLSDIYFPEFKGGNLNNYLKDFLNVEIIEDSKNEAIKFPNLFSKEVIKQAINSENRPILLIDEFESKFYELKKCIETSGGGVLRELFDQVVQDSEMFYLIIGNGPASGYEIAKERGDDSLDSETAANRRLKTKQIPFPTANLLQRSFLKNDPKGYINFIWWLSRCRPGHISKLRDALGSSEELYNLDFSELITKPIFEEPIDDGGESVTYLKTGFFSDIPSKIRAAILNKMLIFFEPLDIDIKDFKDDLKKCVSYFYCSTKTVNTVNELLPVLNDDLYLKHYKNFEELGKYTSVNYIVHIEPYFSYILNGISDKHGDIAFGMINDSNPGKILSENFLIPLLELTYDFISIYQDDSIKETKETLDFLLSIINEINESNRKDDLETLMPNTYELFEKCRLNKPEKVFLQLSLHSIRQSIEQPIGSPQLKYKNQQVAPLLNEIESENDLTLICHKENNLHLFFIPDMEGELLKKYLNKLRNYLTEIFIDKFHKKGEILVRIIYLSENQKISEFKNSLLFINGDISKPEPLTVLKKIDMVNFESYQLNFGIQIRDYIDSISKIGIIGIKKGELNSQDEKKDEATLELRKIIDVIGTRPWTERKETIRTIDHYKKLILEGENSVFKSILRKSQSEYDTELAIQVCDKDKFRNNLSDYSYLNKIIFDDAEDYDNFTSKISLLYLFDNTSADDKLIQLLKIVNEDYKFGVNKEDSTIGINFKNLHSILTKKQNELNIFKEEFKLDSKFISDLSSFTKLLNKETKITNLSGFSQYLSNNTDSHFVESYHKALGGYYYTDISVILYFRNYLYSLDPDQIINKLIESTNKIENYFSEVRKAIVEKLEELKNLIDESQHISSYAEKLSKATRGISYIKELLSNNTTLSNLIILNSIIEHLKFVVEDSKIFSTQIESIIDSINEQKTKVDVIQEKIDIFYKDPLTEKLLDFEFPKKLNNYYLWKKYFLKDNLKTSEEYEKLFGSINDYNPFTSPNIYPDRIKMFKIYLNNIYNKTKPRFDDLLNRIKETDLKVQDTKRIESYITNLLNITE